MPAMMGNIDWGIKGDDDDDDDDDQESQSVVLPLNLIALIISYLDNPADLARACRASRVLYYMTLPNLYKSVTLRSYDYIRISPETRKPEGCGGASPFSMSLNTLVTRNVASYVKELSIWGQWKEYDLEECAKVGRVPDGSMMMAVLVRAALDRCSGLESFSWHLDTKLLPTIWVGLSHVPNLTSLFISFPANRLPRPTIVAPPIPNLRSLTIINIDPLCHPDDISELLQSEKLERLKMHWSPRMRDAREPSTNLHFYFGRMLARGYRMKLKSVAFQNLYAGNEGYFQDCIDTNTIKSFTMISSMVGLNDSADMSFMKNAWRPQAMKGFMFNLKMLRGDKVSNIHIRMLKFLKGLDYYYLVSGRKLKDRPFLGVEDAGVGSPHSPASCATALTPATPSSNGDGEVASVGRQYLDIICVSHGKTLRHLLLMPQWRLSSEDIARLIRSCPNLEQLAMGVEAVNFNMMRLLIPFSRKLHALRILDPPDDNSISDEVENRGDVWHEEVIGIEAMTAPWTSLRYMCFGEILYEIIPQGVKVYKTSNGEVRSRRIVKRRPLSVVHELEIFKMDRLEI